MQEVRRILEIAEGGDAVTLGGFGGLCQPACRPRRQGCRKGSAGNNDGPSRQTLPAAHERPPTFAALASSHHHTVGKPDIPYFGRVAGWPNRSQRALRTLP